MMTTIKTWLPCFPGFYESHLYHSDMPLEALSGASCELVQFKKFPSLLLEAFLEKQETGFWPGKFCQFEVKTNNQAYRRDVAKEYCRAVQKALKGMGFREVKIKFESIYSPREYNFETDSVNCEISFDPDRVKDYLEKHYYQFKEHLEKEYTSRPGYISRVSNHISDWMNPEEWGVAETGAGLEFIMRNENPDIKADLCFKVLENCYYSDYLSLPAELDNWLDTDEAVKIGEEFNRLMKQGDLYFQAMKKSPKMTEDNWRQYAREVAKGKDKITDDLCDEMLRALLKYVGLESPVCVRKSDPKEYENENFESQSLPFLQL